MASRSPRRRCSAAATPSAPARPTYTSPTGFSGVPAARPGDAGDRQGPVAADQLADAGRHPSATGAETALWRRSRPGSTPRTPRLTSSEYEITPPSM